jgi:hypothetical protein
LPLGFRVDQTAGVTGIVAVAAEPGAAAAVVVPAPVTVDAALAVVAVAAARDSLAERRDITASTALPASESANRRTSGVFMRG